MAAKLSCAKRGRADLELYSQVSALCHAGRWARHCAIIYGECTRRRTASVHRGCQWTQVDTGLTGRRECRQYFEAIRQTMLNGRFILRQPWTSVKYTLCWILNTSTSPRRQMLDTSAY